jgi:hypothetical protein
MVDLFRVQYWAVASIVKKNLAAINPSFPAPEEEPDKVKVE